MDDVIDALDGVPKVAALAKSKINNVLMWQRDTGRFPAKTYTVMKRALAEKGYDAPPALWGMLEP